MLLARGINTSPYLIKLPIQSVCQVGLVVRVSASHTVGREFASTGSIPKTIIKMVQTASLHGTQCVRVGV